MQLMFDDEHFSYQLLKTLGASSYGGADIGECLSTAARIKDGDGDSWYTEWFHTAERIHGIAQTALTSGHTVSACGAFLRAMKYYRVAESYLHGRVQEPRIGELARRGHACFRSYMDLCAFPLEPVEIPYQGDTLPGFFYPASSDDPDERRPTVIAQLGFDGTQEELVGVAFAAVSRGYNCLTFEGPGQGRVLREKELPLRPDWETVIMPVLEFLLDRPAIDPNRIALVGYGLGGHLAARAAAFEPRITTLISNGGFFSLFNERMLPPQSTMADVTQMASISPDAFNRRMLSAMEKDRVVRWSVQTGMHTFRAPNPADYWLKGISYTLEGIAHRIQCPTLVLDAENDIFYGDESKRLNDALTCPKTYLLFTAEEGADAYTQAGAELLANQRMFDWLDEVFAQLDEPAE